MAFSINENCIGCTACAALCPVFAINGTRGEKHSINEKRCVECGVCGKACPKAAVCDGEGNVCHSVKRTEWAKPVVDTARCSACAMCVSICTKDALSISLPTFKGDLHVFAELSAPQKCVGCAMCEDECPLGAIRMEVSAK